MAKIKQAVKMALSIRGRLYGGSGSGRYWYLYAQV
jgi:hypothetical protein